MKLLKVTRFLAPGILMASIGMLVAGCNDSSGAVSTANGTTDGNGSVNVAGSSDTGGSDMASSKPGESDRLAARDSQSPAPSGLTVTPEGESSLALNWRDMAGVSAYRIYWSEAPGVTQQSPFFDSVASSFVHQGLMPGTSYYYRISAWAYGEESQLSSEYKAYTGNPPAAARVSDRGA